MNKRAVVFIACTSSLVAAVAAILLISQVPNNEPSQPIATVNSYIVQGQSMEAAATAVRSLDGEITHELGVIRAVAAELTLAQVAALRAADGIRRIYDNGSVETAGKPNKDGNTNGSGNNTVYETHYPTLTRADEVHAMGILGDGIGIAVLDTGLWKHEGIRHDAHGSERIDVVYDAIADDVANNPMSGSDPAGHGTHVTSIAVSSLVTDAGGYNGIAPGAHLISVRAFDEFGQGTYADVIRAIDWVVANRNKHKIRILNLSFSAEPRSYYWDDPINQAVMVAWQNEIFVVAAAGNRGPDAMTIGVPGNVPYVLTVGAMTDSFTPADPSDDNLASFSSAGPTVEGFVKPEVVAPGGHMIGLMEGNAYLANEYPSFYYDGRYFEMSGTSQATAAVAGIAALALQAEPWRSVDELKCKLMSAAKPAVNADGSLAYSIFQQGAGLVDAYAAVHSQNVDCANNGLHIDNDIDGYQHFGGRANQMANAGSEAAQATVRDEFATVSYSNNDGSAAWSGSWVEANDDGSPTSGTVRIDNARLRMDNSDSGSLESISRAADLAGASSAALSFDVDGYGYGGLDVFMVEASDDGGQTLHSQCHIQLQP
jgi:serine protease AprX